MNIEEHASILKAALRKEAKLIRSQIDTSEEDRIIREKITRFLLAADPGQTVLSYLAMPSEFQTAEILNTLARERPDLKLYAPRVATSVKQGALMNFHLLPRQDGILWEELERDKWGILQPAQEASLFLPEDASIYIIVPALFLDREGYRIGYGGGYYDRFLKRLGNRALTLTPCRKWQLRDKLPHDHFDMPVDLLFGQSRVILTDKKEFPLNDLQRELISD